MELHKLIKQELERGFTKSELERIWELPKNCLSAVLNVESKVKLSKKAEVRVKAYFYADPITRPDPSPRIARKGNVVGVVSLPKDYVSFDNIAVLNEDGSTTTIDTSAMEGLDLAKDNINTINQILKAKNIPIKVKPKMPKGLSLTQQLEWREKNL